MGLARLGTPVEHERERGDGESHHGRYGNPRSAEHLSILSDCRATECREGDRLLLLTRISVAKSFS
jgi:hypothetical protein